MTTAIESLQYAQARAMSLRPKAGGFPVLAKVLHQAGVHRNECGRNELLAARLGVNFLDEPQESTTTPRRLCGPSC